MAQTKPKKDSRADSKSKAFVVWTVTALVTGKNGRTYVVQKRRKGEWRCNCRTPVVCQHMKRAWKVGVDGSVDDNGVAIELPSAFR
jgi:hypothetical protein